MLRKIKITSRLIAFSLLLAAIFSVLRYQQSVADFVFARKGSVKSALTSVTLNNGNLNVITGNDVTSQTTALSPDIGAYRWTVNGSNFMSHSIPGDNGATATDTSGNAQHMTIVGATYQTGCKVGGCFSFDNTDDYLRIDLPATVKTPNITMEAWVNVTSFGPSGEIVISALPRAAGAFGKGGYLFLTSSGHVGFNKGSGDGSWEGVASVNPITTGTWYHIAGSYDGANIRVYINGVLENTVANAQAIDWTDGAGGNYPDPGQLYIGASKNNALGGGATVPENIYGGMIDEARIYPRALSGVEIAQSYDDGNAGLGGPTIIQSEETVAAQVWNLTVTPITSPGSVGSAIQSSNPIIIADASNGITGSFGIAREDVSLDATVTVPVGSQAGLQWKVNNTPFTALNVPFNTGTAQIDVGGNAITATATNGPVYTNTGCQVGGCMTFDGVNDYINLGSPAALSMSGQSFTVSAWVNFDSLVNNGGIVSDYRNTNGRWLLEYQQPPGQFLFAMDTNGTWGPERAVGNGVAAVVGTWYHVVGLYDHSTGALKLYVNGSLASTENGSPVTIGAVNNPVIGSWYDLATAYMFDGKIDEVQIYRRALTADEISLIYADGVANRAAPTTIHRFEHVYNQTWQLLGYEFVTSSGSSVGPVMIGSNTIASAATTTITPTTPSGTQNRNITIQYTCSNADTTARDFLVEYSTNGGSSYSSASLVSTSSGTVSGSYIYGATCNGSTQSLVWNSVANLVASGVLDNDVRIRLTAVINAAPSGATGDFSVQNPFIFTTPTSIGSANTTYDNTEVLCSGTTLTIDGTHPFAALDLTNGCTLTHSANTTAQTNTMNLSIAGNATIDATSTINLNGKGYSGGGCSLAGNGPGGGPVGGNPGSGEAFGQGGASYGGRGGTGGGSGVLSVASSYGSLPLPNEIGSGGAGGGFYNCSGSSTAGGSGGGLLVMSVSGTLTLNGTITSNGSAGTSNNSNAVAGGGSGGGIRVTAGTITGSGTISANGGNASNTTGSPNYGYGGAGGGGRIAVYYTTNTHTNLSGSVFAYGGPLYNAGSAGTIYVKPSGDNFGDLIMTNNNVAGQNTTIISGVTQFDTITISNGASVVYAPATLELDETLTIGGTATTRFALSGTTFTSSTGVAAITINSGGILSHDFNTTTRVNYIDIAGIQHLTINSGGSVNVDGRGYRGGTTYCANGAGPGAGQAGTDPGSGSNFDSGGASHGGRGGTGNNSNVAASYGSPTEPTELGSGGAGGGDYLCNGGTTSGGAGGGAIKIVGTGTATINGSISANGAVGVGLGGGGAGGGAGGSIWLNFATIAGSGTMSANGANATETGAGSGGGGRVALYYTTNSHSALSTSTTSRGGLLYNAGGAGSIYFKPSADNFGDLQFSNGGTAGQYTTLFSGVTQVDTLTVLDAANIIYQPTTLEVDELITVGGTATTTFAVSNTAVSSTTGVADIVINNNGVLSHDTNTTTQVNDLEVTGFRHATINSGGSISILGKGFQGGSRCTDGSGTGGGKAGPDPGSGADFPGGGGTYGGRGGNGQSTNYANFYGSITSPALLGSGGAGGGDYFCNGGASNGGAGGGYVKLVLSGTLTVNGSINANGAQGSTTSGQSGGGSGGSIWLDVDTIAGSGTISAAGGNPSSFGGGAGGGGRIAIYYDTNMHSGLINAISVAGGSVSNYGSSGTAFIKDNAQSYGDFKADNDGFNSVHYTNLYVTGQPATYTFRDLYVIDLAELLIDTPCLGTPALTVTGSTYLTNGGTITNNQSLACTVSQTAVSITTTSLAAGIVGVAYNQTIASTGGYAPHSFVCRNGGVTVACSTVLPPGLSMSTAGVITGTPTTAGTYNVTVRATESSPGVGFDEESLSIAVGNAPTSPINLFVGNTSAQLGATNPSGIDASPVFSAEFSDPDLGDTGSLYRIQVASDAGFTSLLWDSGASGTALGTPCTNNARCVDIAYGGSALSLTATTYHWRIKYWDILGIEGPYSLGNTFTTDQAPTAPTVLYSNDSNAQAGLTNPVGILATHPVFSAVFNDPDLGDTATKYRLQVSTTNNFSAIVWDSGSGGTNMTSCNEGDRCTDIVYGGTDLARDETTYYWRIKFWDVAGVEGAWSQDPNSTNTFKMGTGGGSIQVIQQQQQAPQPTVPDAPIAGAVEVLGPNSVRYNWIDVSANETGFRVLNAQNQVIVDVAAGQTSAVEASLSANTLIEGRFVLSYNNVGQSVAVPFSSVRTAAPVVRPTVSERGGDQVTFIIEPAFVIEPGQTLSFPGQTAVRFDVIVTNSEGLTRTLSSDWVQANQYTFSGISADDEVQVRVVTRNATGLQNEPSVYEDIGALSRRFVVGLSVLKKGTQVLPRPMVATDTISVRMSLTSVGTDPADSVVINMPLPRYVTYVPGSLIVDGRNGTDQPDQQGTVANRNGVSASWATVRPGEAHTVSFELLFDLEDLRGLQETGLVGTPDQVIASLVQATANPLIHLQASVSFANSDAVYMSPVITLEPDVETAVEPVIEETPVDETPSEEQPVQLPTPEETQIIEQILQQEFPSPTPTPLPAQPEPSTTPAPAPMLQTGETISNSDAGSFNLSVTGEDNKLGMTGAANVAGESIQFTGTTTEPFTVITLIFNNSITAIAVSDANGFWQTFVDADRLGILPGQEAVVKVEAIAAKGDLRSERVQVGEVTISRGRSGDIEAEFDTVVSESAIITAVAEIRQEIVRVVEQQEPVIQATLTVAAPIVVVSSVPLWGYLPYAPSLIYHVITYAVGAIGRKKHGGARFYGIAYDSISKQPLALAIIRIYQVQSTLTGAAHLGASATTVRKLVTTIVTDKQGRYEALLEPGNYQLEVAKPQYLFPSQIVNASMDGDFQHVYDRHQGIRVDGNEVTIPDVPLDPINAQRQWQLATGGKKVWMAIQRMGNYLAAPILIVGAVTSAVVVFAIPDKPMNWVIAGCYLIMLALQLRLRHHVEKAWGVVYDVATNAVLPLTTIQLIEPASSKVVMSRLSDYQGRFAFLPEPGTYVIKATRQGFQQVEVIETPSPERQPFQGEVEITQINQRITGDIAMRQMS